METKVCTRCHLDKPLGEFSHRAALVGGRRSTCKMCDKTTNAAHNKLHPEKLAECQRKSKLKSTYGMSPEEYEALFQSQGRCCKLCGGTDTHTCWQTGKPKRMPVDHNHTTGKIRGILCPLCNVLLGAARDNPALLRAAASYVERDGA